jgi:16S rRNA C967 or C1407 C5-methylase (RsmB/RsmF family)
LSESEWPHAAQSELWSAVQTWRKDAEPWLLAAEPRLPETLRVNPLRPDRAWTEKKLRSLGGEPIPWLPGGGDDGACGSGAGWRMPWQRGRCPDAKAEALIRALHDTGRITRQEAVSMIPVTLLSCEPGHRVLDLCASPGSKATQLCEAVSDSGVVMANESNPGRANLLVSNAQRAGVISMVVTQHDGRHLPRCPNPGFDRVLVDAPCTGNATTRKNPEVWQKWRASAGRSLHTLQLDLARKAALLLRPGGKMVYSTCSLDPIENEAVVAELLRSCDFMRLVDSDVESACPGLVTRPGMVDWPIDAEVTEPNEVTPFSPPVEPEIVAALPSCVRVWNDENDSGGFFVALLEHIGDSEVASALTPDSEMATAWQKEPPNGRKHQQVPAASEAVDEVASEWGVEGVTLFHRGQRLAVLSDEIQTWLWAGERMLRKGGKLPGGHWHPFQVIQAGLPAWDMRKGRLQRPTSKAMHLLGPMLQNHVHETTPKLLSGMLLKGGPLIEEAIEEIPSLEGERGGGIVLRLEQDDSTWWVPAWVGQRLTLMVPDAERVLLGVALGVELEQ